MGFVVKITTLSRVLDLICPYSCRGCGVIGSILCENCKRCNFYNTLRICPLCQTTVDNKVKKCCDCESPFEEIFVGGWREGVLAKLVHELKYEGVRAVAKVLAELLDVRLGDAFLDEEVVVVPLPTIGKHVRERGVDHTMLLAKELARRRGWKVERILERKTNTVQVGAKAAVRQEQAAKTYEVAGRIDGAKTYLLVDDVWTTGATMLSAAKVMQKAGAKHLLAAVVEVGKPKLKKSE